ncbi:MAG: hypothetical protein AB7C97_03650 [Oscillospiraceae bacterium]
MIEDMRAQLAALSAKLERMKKVDSMLENLQREEQNLAQSEKFLKTVLSKEEADVGRLERTTAASVIYSMLGKRDAKLDKEQQEAYAARLKYDSAARQLDDCKMRMDELRRERESLADCRDQYDKVFAGLQELLRENPDYAERLCALERQRGEAQSQLKELDEAISAGDAAMWQVNSIENSLGSAEGWGTWDLLGGGLISDLAKHSHLDDAQAGAEHLQILLSRFQTELADVYINPQLGAVNVEGFLRFADYFFDGLIADWSVLSHIHDSQASVARVKQQVGDALSKLHTLKSVRAGDKAAVEKQIAELVAKA